MNQPLACTGNADTLPVIEDASPPPGAAAGQPWRVLIVDDDRDVHVATELAMRDVAVEGRALQFLHAHSAAEAARIVEGDAGIAVLLLDVVMETPDAGLRLVRQIREQFGRRELRVILRTGQPGYAPEIETLRSFDINDYRTKAELTRARLFCSLTAAIRAYAQLSDLTRQRDDLARLNAELERARAAEVAEAGRREAAEQELRQTAATVEQCVEQRTRELSLAVAELDTFNRMVSHDLRGPLHGLAGLTGMIRNELDGGDPAQARRWLEMMEKQTRRLAELVGELLALARASKGELERRPVALRSLVDDALQTLALGPQDVRLSCVSVGPLPELAVDGTLMRQVFLNLLSNALKFTRLAPAPRVEVGAERRGAGWALWVRDNGVGFDPARRDELFKPFARLHDSRFEGTGVGLTIARRVVERHGGTIRADNRPGGGTVFEFTLPDPA